MLSKRVKSTYQLMGIQARFASQHLSKFATMDPKNLTPAHKCMNLVNGEWVGTNKYTQVIDPMTGKPMISIPDTQVDEIEPFVQSLLNVPKYGLHNPLHNKERYVMLGEVSRKTAEVLHDPEVFNHFVKLTQRGCPKSDVQTAGEIRVTRQFF